MQKFLLNKEIREENVITIPKPFSEGGVILCLVLTKMLDGIILKHYFTLLKCPTFKTCLTLLVYSTFQNLFYFSKICTTYQTCSIFKTCSTFLIRLTYKTYSTLLACSTFLI